MSSGVAEQTTVLEVALDTILPVGVIKLRKSSYSNPTSLTRFSISSLTFEATVKPVPIWHFLMFFRLGRLLSAISKTSPNDTTPLPNNCPSNFMPKPGILVKFILVSKAVDSSLSKGKKSVNVIFFTEEFKPSVTFIVF